MTSRKALSLILFLALVTLGVLFVDGLARAPADQVATSPEDELVLVLGDAAGGVPAAPVEDPGGEEGLDWHIVEKGETLRGIAAEFLGDPDLDLELAALNGLSDPDHIEEGLLLRLR